MDWKDSIKTTRDQLRNLNKAIPETAKGFGALSKGAMASEGLDKKSLEFVALGIAVADHCDPCIGFHIEALIRIGATRDEVAAVLGMAVQMGGGPSLMYAAKALDCYDQLAA